MSALLHAELLKLRTTRTFAALTAVAVLTSLVLTLLTSLLDEPTQDSVLVDVFASDTSSLFILVLAIVGITGEWRHRTITSSLLAAPDRLRFLAAKTLAFAAAGLVLSVLISLSVAVVGLIVLNARDLPTPEAGELLGQIALFAMVAALGGAFGVGVGAVVRNQAIAIVVVLALSFAIEPTLLALAPDVARFGPMVALPTAAADITAEDIGFDDVAFLDPGVAVALLLAWIAVLFAIGAVLLRRRDVD